ncbi:MAG: single-stranded-DNA-specific exonuclease RecJ [candidate division Zixibacteria bacterium]|nr:single-stranded-DNA-specific exonuclease RecJ [candidate division Zixibacteria bacterium]
MRAETTEKTGTNRWVFPPEPPWSLVQPLIRELDIPAPLAKILANRGFDNPERADKFLNPKLEGLCDPFLLPSMRPAVELIIGAIREKEPIMVFGDYDVDGITATALMFLVLSRLGAQVSYYLPNRLVEGYGLSEEGFQEAKKRDASWVITVDCGITAVSEVAFGNSLGIRTIITDHHEPASVRPDAAAIVNPKLGDSPVGEELSGVGIAYKFAQALYAHLGQEEVEEHLDLVALGTLADIVPLTGENRILSRFGVQALGRTNKPGLKSLAFVAGLLGKEISAGQVVFVLAPRINAIGRLGSATEAIRLLTTRDEKAASEIARLLDGENRKRRSLDEAMLEEALALVEREIDLSRERAIVLASDRWHPGVIGIVASRLVERFHRPTIMIAVEGEEGKGSARSIHGFHLTEALKACEAHLLRYGGHKYAAGLSIARSEIEGFRQKINEVSSRLLSDEDLIPRLEVDAELGLHEINDRLVETLQLFAPFGPANSRPVFVTRGLEFAGLPVLVGNNHLKFRVRQGGQVFETIGFGMGNRLPRVLSVAERAGFADLAYTLDFNAWNGQKRIQLQLKDIRLLQ